MKLNFITKDNQVLPVVDDYRFSLSNIEGLIENVVKCTVSSDRENQTIMTVTVFVDRPDIQPPSFTVDGVLDTGRNL